MRQIIGAAIFAAVVFSVAPATARDYPYCLQGQDYGYPGLCRFTSYEQCEASASGTFSYCDINPRFAYGSYAQQRRSYSRQGW
jgi:hypothetical protein